MSPDLLWPNHLWFRLRPQLIGADVCDRDFLFLHRFLYLNQIFECVFFLLHRCDYTAAVMTAMFLWEMEGKACRLRLFRL